MKITCKYKKMYINNKVISTYIKNQTYKLYKMLYYIHNTIKVHRHIKIIKQINYEQSHGKGTPLTPAREFGLFVISPTVKIGVFLLYHQLCGSTHSLNHAELACTITVCVNIIQKKTLLLQITTEYCM